jgi:hypothetical protein
LAEGSPEKKEEIEAHLYNGDHISVEEDKKSSCYLDQLYSAFAIASEKDELDTLRKFEINLLKQTNFGRDNT